MINEILEVFNENLQNNPNLILDNYDLKEGLYVKLDEKKCEHFIVKSYKKDEENKLLKLNGEEATSSDVTWFKQRDYLSVLWDTNKAVFDKKFHSINYLTLFFKVENFDYTISESAENFDVFKSFSKFNKSKDKEILSFHKNYIDDKNRLNKIDVAKNIIISNLQGIKNIALDNEIKKGYIKIFIDSNFCEYEDESKIYLDLKIFNDNSYNILKNGAIYGLSNFNMGMNSKKPFLEHKNRKKIVPILLTQENVLMQKALFDWLSYQSRKFIDDFKNFYLLRFNDNGKAIITDYDYIPIKKDDYNFKPFAVKDFLNSGENSNDINKFSEFQVEINQTLYSKQLLNNIFNNDIKVNSYISKDLQNLLYQTKDTMAEYFYKFSEDSFLYVIKKHANDFIKIALQDEKFGKKNAIKAINLIFSIREIKGESMDLEAIINTVSSALKSENIEKLNQNEYCFLAGQVAMVLMHKSKTSNKTYALAEPYLKAKNIDRLKNVLKQDFDRYRHEIYINDAKFSKAYLLLQNFDNVLINSDMESMILAGMMAKNIIYDDKK
ncbi:hypothetical protein [Campylobacter geochelonis]|uniref:Uncharacterized protein n=1 Tax=Campylobacter geochelonis TaxID=1780362 RepID=A0A128EEU0_9BACT|nr:hypothetical protein [Campylobacter geochelonis]QKF70968.1 CRISPR/Cas system-associated protein Cas8, type I-B [Campylobacter geochelonis]CZE47057.1 Uncharacterised protein [Campylobacter geochelonis]